MDYNELAQQIYAHNKAVGWWDNPDRCLYECLQLVSTEVAEATEAERKDLMDDHLPHRKGGEVELADALIRVLDLGGKLGLKYQGVSSIRDRFIDHWSTGRRHHFINEKIVHLSTSFQRDEGKLTTSVYYSFLIDAIVLVAESYGYDLEATTTEKLAYNKTRADHKRENRAQTGGKKF